MKRTFVCTMTTDARCELTFMCLLFVDIAVERGFNSFAEHLNMLLDEAYVDEESCDPEEKKMSEDDNDNISLRDDFEETALAEKEWDEREVEAAVENKEARQGRVRSGQLEHIKLIEYAKSHT